MSDYGLDYWHERINDKLETFLDRKLRSIILKDPASQGTFASVEAFEAAFDSGKDFLGFKPEMRKLKSGSYFDSMKMRKIMTSSHFPGCMLLFEFCDGCEYDHKREKYIRLKLKIGETEAYCEIENKYIGNLDTLLKDFGRFLEVYNKRQTECEKEFKLVSLQQNTLDDWLKIIAAKMTLPYYIEKMATKTVFMLKLPNDTQLEIAIPHKHFQDVMPKLYDTIQSYISLQESNTRAKVLISNLPTYRGVAWKVNGSAA
jgi:hypothetical protein